jgi:hypothetical protein
MNVEELKQACFNYFSRYYSEFEDFFYIVVDNMYKNIDFPDFFIFVKFDKYNGIGFKIIDKNTYLDTENVDIIDVGSNEQYRVVYIRSLDEFERALSSYLKNYLYKN